MWGAAMGIVLVWVAAGTQLDLDCARPAAAHDLVGRVMLSEIEGAEDIARGAMWEAFGRCPAGPAREACVVGERKRFETTWERDKAAIERKYERMLEDFDARCRGSVI